MQALKAYEEVAEFEQDPSPDAWPRLVDRLLASPRYGERWGRHWLDVARYADNKGYVFFEEKNYPWAYTYRDYVIRSLNEDRPFLSGNVTFFDDDPVPDPAPGTLVLKAIAGYYAMRALKGGESLPEPRLNDNQLSFQLAQAVMDVHIRQTILMSRSEADRIKRLAGHFPLTAARERRKEHFRTLVPRNGHARLLPSS